MPSPCHHPHNHQTAFTAFHDRDTASLTALEPVQPAAAPLSPFPSPSPPPPPNHPSPLAFQTSFPHSPTPPSSVHQPHQPAAHLKPTFPPGFETTFPGSDGFETTFPSSQPAHPLTAHHGHEQAQFSPQQPLHSPVTIRPFPHLPPTQSAHPAPQLGHQTHSTPPPPPPPAFTRFTSHSLPALQPLHSLGQHGEGE